MAAPTEREAALETLIRSLQQEADMEVDVWREVGNAIMAYTSAKRQLRVKLMKAVEKLDGLPSLPTQPLTSQPLPSMPYPAYQNPTTGQPYVGGSYPSTSAQAPWPPENRPNGNAQPQQAPQPWRLKDAMAAASRG